MIGCSSKNAFKVGDIEFLNQDVERVESILTATSNYTDANYLSDFKSSKDNKEITSKVIIYKGLLICFVKIVVNIFVEMEVIVKGVKKCLFIRMD